MHHHRDNSRTQESLSAKDVLRAEGRRDERIGGGVSIIPDTQTRREINTHLGETNNVSLNYYSRILSPKVRAIARCPWFPVSRLVVVGARGYRRHDLSGFRCELRAVRTVGMIQ